MPAVTPPVPLLLPPEPPVLPLTSVTVPMAPSEIALIVEETPPSSSRTAPKRNLIVRTGQRKLAYRCH